MTEAGTAPVTARAAAALARADGFSVPAEPEAYTGTRGPQLDALTDELTSLLAELPPAEGDGTAAGVAARLGRCHAVRFVLEGAPADRERALPLLEQALGSPLLAEADRDAVYRDLVALVGSRLVRLSREVMAMPNGEWTVDRLMSLAALGTPLAKGGSGMVEDSALLVRLLLQREHPAMEPQLRENLRTFGEMTDALRSGDTAALVRGGRRIAGTMPGGSLPSSLGTMVSLLLDQLERGPSDEAGGAPADDSSGSSADTRHFLSQLLAFAEVMSPGLMAPQQLSALLAELSGDPAATAAQDGPAPLPSRMVAALAHVALATRTGDMEGFRTALRLMHEASANGELDSRSHGEWLRAVVPGLLLGAALTGGSLQDEDMARDLLEAQRWEGEPTSDLVASLRLCGEAVRLHGRVASAVDRGDVVEVEDIIDELCELELDETYDGAEAWTGALTGFVLGMAYLSHVVLVPYAEDRTAHLRAAVHHLQRAVETSVDVPVLRSFLDIAWAPLITLTAIVESDPGRIAEGVQRARAALDATGFTSDFRPRARGGIALALDTLHLLTGDTGALDEAIGELTQAVAELPDGSPGSAGLTWDLAALHAKRAGLRGDGSGGDAALRAGGAGGDVASAVGVSGGDAVPAVGVSGGDAASVVGVSGVDGGSRVGGSADGDDALRTGGSGGDAVPAVGADGVDGGSRVGEAGAGAASPPEAAGVGGDLRAAVGLARRSLRLSADDVLLQQGVGRGLRIARAAADRGRRAAFWALRAGLAEEAIACLEAGRSLVLGAAAVSAGVADRLTALGETELAGRWREAAAEPSWERADDDRSLLELSAEVDAGAGAVRERSAAEASADARGDAGGETPGRDALGKDAGGGPGAPGAPRERSPLEVLAAVGAGVPGLPGDLRRRSLELLRGRGGADVEPVVASVDDLRAGLRATGADALLYLIPGLDDADGAVLVVPADGPVTALPLPGLTPGGRQPVARYLAAGADRQRLEAADEDTVNPRERERAERRWLRALDDLCVWAGGVLGPALDHLALWDRALAEAGLTGAAADGAGSRTADAPPSAVASGTSAHPRPAPPPAVRLVIVPCGELGVVPWQAGVLEVPGVARAVRVCEVGVLTYAASGREFLRAAARRRMALTERPALVFHAVDDLEWAEEEIETLAGVLYPGALVHHPDDDPATPETVLALLGGRATAPASLVHLACHGLAGPDPTRSALHLAASNGAGEASGELTLSTLLETPAEGDAFRSAGPLVVCGGCETDLTTRDHDEALTVTSVLVHRLAADAIGSRWKVDDMRSELLMLVLHDALARGMAPPDALRAAQRWMLTPPGERPPVPALRGLSAPRRLAEDFRDRPDTWAAFVHHGNPAPAAPARRREGERA
ncbi:CHAT domain-containing protein [Streptomyces sp. NPDC047841]|uniref:CHAT domain-containing protein n=1 Tax=Streptomyces sp. NPDC047841 TaxID=3154708 RepID=UPI0034523FEA